MTNSWRWFLLLAALTIWTILLLAPLRSANLGLGSEQAWPSFIPSAAHLIAYTVLSIGAGYLQAPPRLRIWLLFALCTHAIATELIQPWFDRDGSVEDAAFDFLGIFLGLILARRWWFINL